MSAMGTTDVAEELRFFVRTAIFTVLIGTIYWFVSYEEAGSILLAGIVVSAIFFVVVIAAHVRASWRGGRSIKALLGFADTGPDAPLALEEDIFPTSSAWPLAVSIAGVLVGLGLIYGAWLWIPGAALGLAGAWGWLTETR
jgi:hypothetical protein